MVTVQTVTNDLTSRIGQMIDADGYFGSQCVDTVNHVAKTYFGTMLGGNAIDLLNSAKGKGWTVEYNKVGDLNSYPKEGWFFVMDTTQLYGHPYGHVGYVLKADAHKMETLETNVDGNADSLSVGGPLRRKTRDYSGVIGWFKPPYSNSPVPTQKGTVETKVVNGDVFSGLITDVDPNMMNANFDRKTIDRILIHHNAGTNDEAARRTWYKSTGVGTSAHYQVTPDKTWGCVGENAVAFHAGNYEMNQRSIGIEHLNSTGAPTWLIAEETYKRSAKLIADISKRLNIPIDTEHVLPHRSISATLCPGGIDMAKLIRMANEEANGKSTPVKEEPKNPTNSNSFKVRVKISNLRMRKEPTTKSQSLGFITKGVYTIVDTKTGDGHEWGKLKSGAGWIALKYTERL